jgi:FtsP/CotA-like multicopper oxidase with cupredoxin domain
MSLQVPLDLELEALKIYQIVKDVMSTDLTTILAAGTSQNNLINGKMNFNCSTTTLNCTENAGISKFMFTTGKKHRLRIINGGAEGQQKFSIDEHNLTVIAHDFVPVEPYTVNMVSLGIGQRVDVVVEANGEEDASYYMRSTIYTDCSGADQPYALAAIYYPEANQTALPDSTEQEDTLPDCATADYPLESTVPVYEIPVAEIPDVTHTITIALGQNSSGNWLWSMDGSSFRADYNEPVLILANKGNTSFPSSWNVYNSGNATNIRVILINDSAARHPMHLHGTYPLFFFLINKFLC